ncbi:Z1 domain-containing protein [Paradesulfitobacterium ferrireducens]|uniref:Z1 domain-containing protein n=1 Tax=Paradesulfitobacterium ferrireducens TaxID=2816476 RepID=UPI001A90948E|nr:Z1 domain-containing protein [Paradesulfitobacterium ferrireducens]
MDFITTKEAAERWGISQRRVAVLCEQGRIIGVKRTGKTWLLPQDAIKPEDGRTETEKQQRRINIDFGKYYEAKKKMHSYTPALQQCIEEACRYCVENLEAYSEKTGQPLMLLGYIQSGKTRAFTGLMALAFDNKFDMVIILTKNSTALVKQTYKRMRQEFRKEISDNEVEVFDIMNVLDGLTDYELEKKLVVISKKEHRNLDKISNFITYYTLDQRKNCLIIDDEADTTGIGFTKVKDTEDEFYLRKVASKVNALRGTLRGCVFVQVTATPYALYLQPEIESDITKPIKPKRTVLVPPGENYIGGDYYFLYSKDDSHPARLIFEPVSEEENELVSDQKRKNKKSKINDRRTFKIENILTDQTHLSVFKKGLMNFVVGGCVLRMTNKNTHYSYVIHTATQKSSHFSLEAVTREFFKQIKSRDSATQSIIDSLLRESYEDIEKSYTEYGYHMPEFDVLEEAFYQSIQKDFISITVVNSDKEMDAILDEDTGELRLRSPLSIFVGGQVLDRGVTIPRMIGFYYGRNPITMQQDTVMQHSRMFGYRDKNLLSVTRFYTTRRIYENMTLITEMDKSLRENIENKTFEDGIYFLQKHSGVRRDERGQEVRDAVVPCAPSKIALSDVVLLKPYARILPIGFTPIPKSYANKISNDIGKRLAALELRKEQGSEVTRVNVDDLTQIINLTYSILESDEESSRFVPVDYFLSTLNYLSRKKREVLLYTRRGRHISKYKTNGIAYQDAPDTGYELKMLRVLAVDTPVLMLIHQDGTADGWNGSEFWWPVIIAQASEKTTIFALPDADGRVRDEWEV